MVVMTGLQRRALHFRRAAAAELAGSLAGFAAGLALAIAWHNALALLLGQAAASVVTTVLCMPGSRPHDTAGPRVAWRNLAGFASNVSAQNFVYYTIYNLPPLSISRTLRRECSRRLQPRQPADLATAGTADPGGEPGAVPALGAPEPARADPAPFTDVLLGSSLVGMLGFGALFGAATPITRILLGNAFHGVDGVVRILAVFGILNLQFSISGSLQESMRWMRDVWRLQVIKLAVSALLLLMPIVQDMRYAAGVLVLGQALAHSRQLLQLREREVLHLRPVLVGYGQHAMLVIPPALALWGATVVISGLAGQLAATVVIAAVTLAALALLGDRLAGVRALDRRGFVPDRVAGRLRRRPA